jgi:hypothetical protein
MDDDLDVVFASVLSSYDAFYETAPGILETEFASADLRSVLDEWKRFPSFLADPESDFVPLDVPDLLRRTSAALHLYVSDIARSLPMASDQMTSEIAKISGGSDPPAIHHPPECSRAVQAAFAFRVAFERLVAALREFQARIEAEPELIEEEDGDRTTFDTDIIAPTTVDFPVIPTPHPVTPPDIRPPTVDQAKLARLRGQ